MNDASAPSPVVWSVGADGEPPSEQDYTHGDEHYGYNDDDSYTAGVG